MEVVFITLLTAVLAGLPLGIRACMSRRRAKTLTTARFEEPPRLWQRDKILGLDTMYESWCQYKSGHYLELLRERFRVTGNTYQFVQFSTTIINTIEPQNIKALLSTAFEDYCLGRRRKMAFEPVIGHGILTSDGASWRTSRKQILPHLADIAAQDLALCEQHVVQLLSRLPLDGTAVDLQEIFLHFTLGFGMHFFLKTSAGLSGSKSQSTKMKTFGDAFDRAQYEIAKLFSLSWLGYLCTGSEFHRGTFVDGLVQHAYSADDNISDTALHARKNCLLEELRVQIKDPTILRGALLNVLLGSRDTTASLLSHLWFVLARHPDIFEELKKETSRLEGRSPSIDDIKSMCLLRNCIREVLRLYAPIPRNSRTAVRDTILPKGGGHLGQAPIRVRAGTQVGYHVDSLHRSSDIYGPDCEAFVPARWERKSLRPGWGYLPFNGGPRVCPGQYFAKIEVSYVTIRILQHIDKIKPCEEGVGYRERLGLTRMIEGGAWVRMRKDERPTS